MTPIQWFLFGLMVILLIAAVRNRRAARCPREQLGYNCRRGTNVDCECEQK
jgi:hypothetical protein